VKCLFLLIAVVDGDNGAFPFPCPDAPHNGFQANAVFVHRPEFPLPHVRKRASGARSMGSSVCRWHCSSSSTDKCWVMCNFLILPLYTRFWYNLQVFYHSYANPPLFSPLDVPFLPIFSGQSHLILHGTLLFDTKSTCGITIQNDMLCFQNITQIHFVRYFLHTAHLFAKLKIQP
jgi:hypothetical protein